MDEKKLTREDCIALLQRAHASMQENNISGYPKRADFSEREVAAIKSFLGPWPRALEAARIKPPRPTDRLAENREKRRAAKRRRTEERLAQDRAKKPQDSKEKEV